MVRHRHNSVHDFARHGTYLWAACRACGHIVIAYPVALSMEMRGSKDIAKIERRMRCLECGERAAHITAEGGGEAKPPRWIVASTKRDE